MAVTRDEITTKFDGLAYTKALSTIRFMGDYKVIVTPSVVCVQRVEETEDKKRKHVTYFSQTNIENTPSEYVTGDWEDLL